MDKVVAQFIAGKIIFDLKYMGINRQTTFATTVFKRVYNLSYRPLPKHFSLVLFDTSYKKTAQPIFSNINNHFCKEISKSTFN